MARGFNGRPVDQGAGQVSYHPDRPIIHFGSSAEDYEAARLAEKMRKLNFDTTGRMPQ